MYILLKQRQFHIEEQRLRQSMNIDRRNKVNVWLVSISIRDSNIPLKVKAAVITVLFKTQCVDVHIIRANILLLFMKFGSFGTYNIVQYIVLIRVLNMIMNILRAGFLFIICNDFVETLHIFRTNLLVCKYTSRKFWVHYFLGNFTQAALWNVDFSGWQRNRCA